MPAPTSIPINPTPYSAPALEDLEAPRRQTSLDGEAIKIVIHDVDSGPMVASKRRVVLRKDPGDKAHRSKYKHLFIYQSYALTSKKFIVPGILILYTCVLLSEFQ